LPGGHPVDPFLAGAAALAYVLSMLVTLPLRYGFAAITQPAFVLMLFVLPLNAIPMAVAVCTVAGSCLRIRNFPRHVFPHGSTATGTASRRPWSWHSARLV
jgi:hypothetical protein